MPTFRLLLYDSHIFNFSILLVLFDLFYTNQQSEKRGTLHSNFSLYSLPTFSDQIWTKFLPGVQYLDPFVVDSYKKVGS